MKRDLFVVEDVLVEDQGGERLAPRELLRQELRVLPFKSSFNLTHLISVDLTNLISMPFKTHLNAI